MHPPPARPVVFLCVYRCLTRTLGGQYTRLREHAYDAYARKTKYSGTLTLCECKSHQGCGHLSFDCPHPCAGFGHAYRATRRSCIGFSMISRTWERPLEHPTSQREESHARWCQNKTSRRATSMECHGWLSLRCAKKKKNSRSSIYHSSLLRTPCRLLSA